ncbi:hypothetical protein CHELA1G11_21159 [Hyphomicrobiales bacterium]|nr:hypothetical protein CHELA1G11_21159 [Hyphomicrobiales bacterium]CAH1693571.1 hypothetical protein CHELA1G2_21467 [Hyphomicrobiales bacterium]
MPDAGHRGETFAVLSQTLQDRAERHDELLSGRRDWVFKGRHFDRSVILLCVRW